jgi:hypothetical protein
LIFHQLFDALCDGGAIAKRLSSHDPQPGDFLLERAGPVNVYIVRQDIAVGHAVGSIRGDLSTDLGSPQTQDHDIGAPVR